MTGGAGILPLSRFATIGLDELTERAALQTRVDRKYVVPLDHLPEVLGDLQTGTRMLEAAGLHALRYSSCYFDTPWLDSYLGAARGRRRRFKVRTRHYLDTGGSFLEVKTRGGRSSTVKERVPVTGDRLDADAVAHAAALLAAAGIPRSASLADDLAPTLSTLYRRITLLIPAEASTPESRATIDLEWSDPRGRVLRLPAHAVVETKSGSRAGRVDRSLWRRGHRPVPISKYGTGMAAMHPGLPSNKWRRVLDRHLAPALRAESALESGSAADERTAS